MTETSPITAKPIVWNEARILEQGTSFINKKNNELKVHQAYWAASSASDYYSASAKTTAKQFKAVADTSREEIKQLNDAIVTSLNQEIANNPESEKTQQLLKIYSVSDSALKYFTAVAKDSYFPTYFNQSIRDAFNVTAKVAFSASVLSGAAFLTNKVTGFEAPATIDLPMKFSVTAFIAATALRIVNHALRKESNEIKIVELRSLFEKTLNPELVVS